MTWLSGSSRYALLATPTLRGVGERSPNACIPPVSQSLPHALPFLVTHHHITWERQDPRRTANPAFACEEPPFLKERRKSRLPDQS